MIDFKEIKCKFPKIELSYEKNIHKKVQNDIYLTIPKGPKFFAWFKTYKNKNCCFFLKYFKKRIIQEISIQTCCFHDELCSGIGTILYGTKFVFNKTSFFNIENIIYFKGKKISNLSYNKKLNHLYLLMKYHIKQVRYCKNDIIFGTPIIETNIDTILKKASSLPYQLYCIQSRSFTNRNIYNIFIKIEKKSIMLIKAKKEPDIYEMFHLKNNSLEFYDIAYIRDYKMSVYMNSIFRNIKENYDLDLQEESDDENEFQNANKNKYVFLDKEVKMICVYNKRFEKWMPQKIANKMENISSL